MYNSRTSYRMRRWATINRWRRWPRFIGTLGLLALFVGQAFSQTGDSGLFKLNIAKTFETSNSQEWNPNSIHLRGVTAMDIVTYVYRVNPAYFLGRERLQTERFDVDYESSSLPRNVGQGIVMDSVLRMLGLHIVERPTDVDVVILDKPRKLGADIRASYEISNSISIGQDGVTVGHTPISGLCRHLEGYFNKPVFDKTKMYGQFRWELGLRKGMTEDELFNEVKNRLGLEIHSGRERVVMYSVEPIETDSGKR